MSKITINVNDEEMEVDFDTLDKETAEKLGINIHLDEEKKTIKKVKHRKLKNKIIAITPFVVLIAFFLTGFFVPGAWSWNWTFFLMIPAVSIALNIRFNKAKKALSSILCLLVITTYLVTGIFFDFWSWNWVLFFLFPIIWILCGE